VRSWVCSGPPATAAVTPRTAPGGSAQPTATPATLTEQDAAKIVSQAIADQLDSFRSIEIKVTGAAPAGGGTPPTTTLIIHSAYYIDTDTAKANYHAANNFPKFQSIVDALNGESALQEASGKMYTSGTAVSGGKSTPDDIKAFVEEAIAQGAIQSYARKWYPAKFPPGKTDLTDLADGDLQTVIQDWVIQKGIGVDCSGFVLQAAIKARQDLQQAYTDKGLEIPAAIAGDISNQERAAKEFKVEGSERKKPTEIKVGDAWVIGTTHVRIVSALGPELASRVQFDTAESQGGSTHTDIGPTSHTWRTASKEAFEPFLLLEEGGDPAKDADFKPTVLPTDTMFYPIS
jgi:hypothetical protein